MSRGWCGFGLLSKSLTFSENLNENRIEKNKLIIITWKSYGGHIWYFSRKISNVENYYVKLLFSCKLSETTPAPFLHFSRRTDHCSRGSQIPQPPVNFHPQQAVRIPVESGRNSSWFSDMRRSERLARFPISSGRRSSLFSDRSSWVSLRRCRFPRKKKRRERFIYLNRIEVCSSRGIMVLRKNDIYPGCNLIKSIHTSQTGTLPWRDEGSESPVSWSRSKNNGPNFGLEPGVLGRRVESPKS